ncbi:manganese catalase family protein [Actinopolymorpha singaporensis]|uniref:manganese catalase family protein n=1 Tax=Actinopolymorpha singaporensis TaxID=117157 RepID=UPI001F51B2D9|nr:manganese catalase family protein [Actinopolymorpha singaporensis]
MFFHRQELQHKAVPDQPDAVHARKLQKIFGGQYGEITVATQYVRPRRAARHHDRPAAGEGAGRSHRRRAA